MQNNQQGGQPPSQQWNNQRNQGGGQNRPQGNQGGGQNRGGGYGGGQNRGGGYGGGQNRQGNQGGGQQNRGGGGGQNRQQQRPQVEDQPQGRDWSNYSAPKAEYAIAHNQIEDARNWEGVDWSDTQSIRYSNGRPDDDTPLPVGIWPSCTSFVKYDDDVDRDTGAVLDAPVLKVDVFMMTSDGPRKMGIWLRMKDAQRWGMFVKAVAPELADRDRLPAGPYWAKNRLFYSDVRYGTGKYGENGESPRLGIQRFLPLDYQEQQQNKQGWQQNGGQNGGQRGGGQQGRQGGGQQNRGGGGGQNRQQGNQGGGYGNARPAGRTYGQVPDQGGDQQDDGQGYDQGGDQQGGYGDQGNQGGGYGNQQGGQGQENWDPANVMGVPESDLPF